MHSLKSTVSSKHPEHTILNLSINHLLFSYMFIFHFLYIIILLLGIFFFTLLLLIFVPVAGIEVTSSSLVRWTQSY